MSEWRRWEAAPGPDQSAGGAGPQRDRGDGVGLPVPPVPPAPRPEGPGARPGLRDLLLQAEYGSGPGQVSLYISIL